MILLFLSFEKCIIYNICSIDRPNHQQDRKCGSPKYERSLNPSFKI